MKQKAVQKESQALTVALPMYLTAQVTALLFTSLDSPVYIETYQARHFFTVSGWVGAWFVLVLFGLTNALFLLIRNSWRLLFDERARIKLAMGYLLGGLTGMLTLGIRFMPLVPPQYFFWVAGFAVLSTGAYFVWKKRLHRADELFP